MTDLEFNELQRICRKVYQQALHDAVRAIENAGYYCVPEYDNASQLDKQIDYSKKAIQSLNVPRQSSYSMVHENGYTPKKGVSDVVPPQGQSGAVRPTWRQR